jgi:PEGA domain.
MCCFDVASHALLTTVGAMFSKIIGALGLTILLSSCATVVRGVHEDLKVVSEPAGADVFLSTGEKGVTPATFRKRRRGNSFLVTITKPGYYSQTVAVKSKASATGAAATGGNVATAGIGVASMPALAHGIPLSKSGLSPAGSATGRTSCQEPAACER